MKKLKFTSIFYCLFFLIVLASCKNTSQNSASENATTEVDPVATTTQKETPAATPSSSVLCNINGKEWAYTEASGIISNERKYGRIVFITFKKRLDKGSESVQLRYRDDTKELISALIQLKVPKKDGGLLNATYQYFLDTKVNKPQTKISGSIDLTDSANASGDGEIINLPIRFEKNLLADTEDESISVTELKFSGVGYSDLDKAFGNKKN